MVSGIVPVAYGGGAEEEVHVPDTSVIIEGAVSKLVEEGRIRGRIIIHRAVLAELEHQANQGKAIGFAGLDEIKKLRSLAEQGLIEVEIAGERPKPSDIRMASSGAIDALIRDYAWEVGATLITGDRVQAEVARAMGVKVLYIEPKYTTELVVDRFFDSETMSIHLKEGALPRAKKGKPGSWRFEVIRDKPMTRHELEEMARKIVEAARMRGDGYIEVDRYGSTIIQVGQYRIVITRPPLSDGWEITVVRPLVKLRIEDYNLPHKLIKRFEERAEGILIAGAPGMGKTTFAQALAEYYARKGKVVKTIESPRDMQLPADVTQYSKSYANIGELHDILLLSRPDYTVFDEMRNDEDFKLYTDLRLAGIGMIGVVHATTPIDAIQRFIGRVELGMIPSIVDTVVFIDRGQVAKVYDVSITVKLPTGLREADLARPVVEVRDFLTGELEYEIYTFGEETIVMPVKRGRMGALEARVRREIERILPGATVQVDGNTVTVFVPRELSRLLVKKAKKLKKLENKLGINIRLRIGAPAAQEL